MNNKLRTWLMIGLTVLPADIVLAAEVAARAPDGLTFQWGTALLSLAICTMSGVASLLQRVSKELVAHPTVPLAHPHLFVATNMMGSWLAGIIAYVMGQILHWDVWTSLLSMIVASYSGAVFIELVVTARMPVSAPPAHLADPRPEEITQP